MLANIKISAFLILITLLFQEAYVYSPVIQAIDVVQQHAKPVVSSLPKTKMRKSWNFIVYMANNNNLHKFSMQNLTQVTTIGSSPYINILVQLDELGAREIVRLEIEKNNPMIVYSESNTQESTSGTKESLFEFARWAIKNYPAERQALVLWNHGSGIKDPDIWGRVLMNYRDEFFFLNQATGRMELNRNIMTNSGLRFRTQLLSKEQDRELVHKKERGIAFNEHAEEYLTNQDLKVTLDAISTELLGGKKIDVLCMDACHMAMVEIGSQVKNAVNYMVASQEVEPGSGYNYQYLLEPFENSTLSAQDFAQHLVTAYCREYHEKMGDYTQSAINLELLPKVEENISLVANSLLQSLNSSEAMTCAKIIKTIRTSRRLTTDFFDTDYIDLLHFYKSLALKFEPYKATKKSVINLATGNRPVPTPMGHLKKVINDGIQLMQSAIVKNASGNNLPNANGLSIYFPVNKIHESYAKTEFAQTSTWINFLEKYLKVVRSAPSEE